MPINSILGHLVSKPHDSMHEPIPEEPWQGEDLKLFHMSTSVPRAGPSLFSRCLPARTLLMLASKEHWAFAEQHGIELPLEDNPIFYFDALKRQWHGASSIRTLEAPTDGTKSSEFDPHDKSSARPLYLAVTVAGGCEVDFTHGWKMDAVGLYSVRFTCVEKGFATSKYDYDDCEKTSHQTVMYHCPPWAGVLSSII